jgi:hypothetical protein
MKSRRNLLEKMAAAITAAASIEEFSIEEFLQAHPEFSVDEAARAYPSALAKAKRMLGWTSPRAVIAARCGDDRGVFREGDLLIVLGTRANFICNWRTGERVPFGEAVNEISSPQRLA